MAMLGHTAAQRVFRGGLSYVALYLLACVVLPAPASAAWRLLLVDAFLFVPAVFAAVACARAARSAPGAEWGFWVLLALCAAARAASLGLFSLQQGVLPTQGSLRVLGHLCHYSFVVFLTVALLARPDRPRGPREVRSAILEWLMAIAGCYFLIFYFVVLPGLGHVPLFVTLTLQEWVPALLALTLALRVREAPFRGVYRTLAFGLVAGALLGLRANWLDGHGGYVSPSPWDLAWVLPFWSMAVAATHPRGPSWVRSTWNAPGDAKRARLAALMVAGPALVDLLTRLLAPLPALADPRSQLALAFTAALSILVALRVQRALRPPAAAAPTSDSPEARRALGEPSEFLQFASGVAHELNNPLMAVAGWAELALRKGAPREAVDRLLAATRSAAEVVSRLQQFTRNSGTP